MVLYYADQHVHSSFSSDSDTPPETQVLRAIELGMPSICFTDHMDFDYPAEYGISFDLDTDDYLACLSELRIKYEGKISIHSGVEMGLEIQEKEKICSCVLGSPWDFVIGSVHLSGRMDPYYDSFFEGRSSGEAYRSYFEDTLACLQSFDPVFDVLGHLDYVFRCGDRSVTDAWSEWPELMDSILRLLVDKGIGLEVNTGGMKKGLPFQHPHDNLLRRYRELGGELITLGSDAHDPSHLGDFFPQIGEKLLSMGYRYYAVYENRTPRFLPLTLSC